MDFLHVLQSARNEKKKCAKSDLYTFPSYKKKV